MARYDVILLDADNTLFDFDLAESVALTETLEAFGFPAREPYLSAYHQSNRGLWNAFERGEIAQESILSGRFQGFLESVDGAGDSVEMNRFYMGALAAQDQLYPGALAFCRELARNYTLAIVTNGVPLVQHGRMDRSPIGEYISGLYVSGDMGYQKPQRDIFDAVLRDLSISDRRRVLMVGDSLSSDIRGAENADIDSLWYNPRKKSLPKGITPTYTVSSFEEALALLSASAKKEAHCHV